MKKVSALLGVVSAIVFMNSVSASGQSLSAAENQLGQILQSKQLFCRDLGNTKGEQDLLKTLEVSFVGGKMLAYLNGQPTDGRGDENYEVTQFSKGMIEIRFEDNARPPQTEHNLIVAESDLLMLSRGMLSQITATVQYHDTGLNNYAYKRYPAACVLKTH